MIDAFAVIGHVFEASPVASKSIYSLPMLFKDENREQTYEFVVMAHGVEAGHDVGDRFYFRWHDALHDLKLKVRIQIFTFIAYFVF